MVKKLGVLILCLILLVGVGMVVGEGGVADGEIAGGAITSDNSSGSSGLGDKITNGTKGLKDVGAGVKGGLVSTLQKRIGVPEMVESFMTKFFRFEGEVYLETFLALIGSMFLFFILIEIGLESISGYLTFLLDKRLRVLIAILLTGIAMYFGGVASVAGMFLGIGRNITFLEEFPIVRLTLIFVIFILIFVLVAFIRRIITGTVIGSEAENAEEKIEKSAAYINATAEGLEKLGKD